MKRASKGSDKGYQTMDHDHVMLIITSALLPILSEFIMFNLRANLVPCFLENSYFLFLESRIAQAELKDPD